MNPCRRMGLLLAAWLVPSALIAQRLPSDDRSPALTRRENWGMSIGVEVITASFQPTQCLTLLVGVFKPCDDVEWAYKTQGIGVSMNAGVVFLRHYMLGGEVGTVGFSGNRTFTSGDNPPVTYTATTNNSLVGSLNIGLITSPMGKSSKLGRKWWVGALAGHSWWSGERAVKSCSQCNVDPLIMGNAYFLQPFAMFGGGDKDGGGGLRLSYRHYLGGNEAMHSGATFGLFFAFGRL